MPRSTPIVATADRSPWADRYILAVIGLGIAVVGHSLLRLPEIPAPQEWAVLTALAIVAASFPLKVPGLPVYLSISDTFFVAAGMLYGPEAAALTIALDSLIVSVRRRNSPRQLLFNATGPTLALWCGVRVFFAASGLQPMAGTSALPNDATILPLALLATVYFLLNSGFTAAAVALSKGLAPFRFWRDHFAVMSANYFAAGSAAYLLIALVRLVGVGALAVVAPLLLVCHLAMRSWFGRVADAQRHVEHVDRLYMSTISAFSTAIEAKDGVTSDHIHRVQAYAMGLARALGITDDGTVKALEAAALLHDTGKLAIPEHILNKPGKLTAREFETMKAHVDIGADILSSIEFPYPVVPIVRAHHENWNGSGYPRGLRGEEIPIGARILSVVDCFDALTSDRPYRPALSDEAALEIIGQARGTMYDPRVVDTFMQVYRDIAPRSLPQPRLDGLLQSIRGASLGDPPPAAAAMPATPPAGDAGSSELLAFVSLARLASGSPTANDIGALADGHLRHIAPGATVVLFGLDADRARLTPHFAAGPAAATALRLDMRLGDRLSGWVGAYRSRMHNADARLDLSEPLSPARFASATPLVAGSGLSGVLTLYTADPLSDDQCRMIDMIAPHLAGALDAAATRAAAGAEPPARRSAHGLRVVASR